MVIQVGTFIRDCRVIHSEHLMDDLSPLEGPVENISNSIQRSHNATWADKQKSEI